jgi:hypothetical protein
LVERGIEEARVVANLEQLVRQGRLQQFQLVRRRHPYKDEGRNIPGTGKSKCNAVR